MGKWEKYAVCPGCEAKYRAPSGILFLVPFAVCPACGEEKDNWVGRFNMSKWSIRTMRYVPTSQLFRPSTWGSGYWEAKP